MDCRPPGFSLSLGFSRQDSRSGLPFPSPMHPFVVTRTPGLHWDGPVSACAKDRPAAPAMKARPGKRRPASKEQGLGALCSDGSRAGAEGDARSPPVLISTGVPRLHPVFPGGRSTPEKTRLISLTSPPLLGSCVHRCSSAKGAGPPGSGDPGLPPPRGGACTAIRWVVPLFHCS